MSFVWIQTRLSMWRHIKLIKMKFAWKMEELKFYLDLWSGELCKILSPTALDPSSYLALRARLWLRFHN